MKSIFSSLIGIALLFTGSSAAQAFEAGACQADIKKYCKNAKMMGGELKACLHKHLHELSDPCKANIVDIYLKKKQMDKK